MDLGRNLKVGSSSVYYKTLGNLCINGDVFNFETVPKFV